MDEPVEDPIGDSWVSDLGMLGGNWRGQLDKFCRKTKLEHSHDESALRA